MIERKAVDPQTETPQKGWRDLADEHLGRGSLPHTILHARVRALKGAQVELHRALARTAPGVTPENVDQMIIAALQEKPRRGAMSPRLPR